MQQLSPRAKEALEVLRSEMGAAGDGLPKDAARELLVDTGLDSQTAARALETLHANGRIYDVNGRFHLTDPSG